MTTNRIKAITVKPTDLSQIRVVEGEAEIQEKYSDYLSDESNYGAPRAERLFFARSEADVVAICKWASSNNLPLTISAGRTGLTGGCNPLGGVLVTLEQMDALLKLGFDEGDKVWYLSAEVGITLEALNSAVRKKQLDNLKEKSGLDRFLQDPQTYFFPPDPTEMTAHLGGAVAANASGARSFMYKAVREWVRRIRVVLANGDVLNIRRGEVTSKDGKFIIEFADGSTSEILVPTYTMPSTKNAAGLYAKPSMDLIDLFIGSEGILGIITEAEVRLHPYPENSIVVFAFFPSEAAAVAFVKDIRSDSSPVKPTLVEYFDSHAVAMLRDARAKGAGGVTVPSQVDTAQAIIFFEVTFNEADMESTFMATQELLSKHGIGMEDSWAGMEPGDLVKMKAVRHLIPETVNSLIAQRKQQYPTVHKLGTDMAVPDEHLETILAYYKEQIEAAGLQYIIFGHIGDNHLHCNLLPVNDEEVHTGMRIYKRFAQKAVELGGTVSAEHGIGKLKRQFLQVMYGEEGLAQMARVKSALDPQWIINPGNMIPRPDETLPPLD
ncbi:MAG: FAD-binding oxidoreductase [Promethearchaeota archaeon]